MTYIGKKIEVYRNLTKDCWSVRYNGIVVSYAKTVSIENPAFVVRQRGRERVLEERRKNVHAFVRGELLSLDKRLGALRHTARYNPYENLYFYDENGFPVLAAEKANLHKDFSVTWR